MAEHFRLRILKALQAHLEGIVPDPEAEDPEDTYAHDLTGKVIRGRLVIGNEMQPPFLVINESPKPDFGVYVADGEGRIEKWQLLIQGFAKDDPENLTDPLYALLLDVEERLMQIIHTSNRTGKPSHPDVFMLPDADGKRQISELEISPPVVRAAGGSQSEPAAKACFFLPLRVGLAQGVG